MKILSCVFLAAALLSAPCSGDESPIAVFLDSRMSGDARKYENAAKALLSDARNNLPVQQFLVAVVSGEPDAPRSTRIDADEKARFLELSRYKIRALAQRNNNPVAWYLLSMENGNAGLLKKAADLDEVHALNDIGSRRLEQARKYGETTVAGAKLMREAFGYFTRAAAKNDLNAFYNLGLCYLNGWGCAQDAALALENLRLAVAEGHPKAMSRLGEMYRDAECLDRDPIQAVRYFTMSANAYNPDGQYNYAKALLDGDGVESNPARAVEMFKKSALQGHVDAMHRYARCICDGIGFSPQTNGVSRTVAARNLEKFAEDCESRRKEAFAIWRNLSEKFSYPPAMDAFGMCLLDGVGTEPNGRLGALWLKRSADKGYSPAMMHLADCWDEGRGGFRKNHYNANWWRTCASANDGDRNAAVWLFSHKLQ